MIFIIAVFPLLLFAFGYRLSLKEWKILRAGGLSISSVPSTGTKIFVNNVLEKETSILSRHLFLQGLTPHTYAVRIEKDGYFAWEKNLQVLPERVTFAEVLLVKQNPHEGTRLVSRDFVSMRFYDADKEYIALKNKKDREQIFEPNARTFVAAPNNKATTTPALPARVRTILREKKAIGFDYDDALERLLWWNNHEVWVVWLRGEDYLPLYTEKTEEKIFATQYSIQRAAFYPAQAAAIITFGKNLLVVELDGRDRRNEYILYTGQKPDFIVSAGEETIYVLDAGTLLAIPTL